MQDADYLVFNKDDPFKAVSIPEGNFLLAYRGSIAHGMHIPNSDPNSIDDVDLIGFCVAPREHYLGLTEWGSRGTKEIKEGKWDCVFYEAKKAFSLLLQGNPNILGSLWTRREELLYTGSSGQDLINCRKYFVGKHVYNAFAGYAHGQMEKMTSRDPAELREYIAVDWQLKCRGIHPNHKGEFWPDNLVESQTGEKRDVLNWSDEKLFSKWRAYHKKGENIGYLGDKRKQLVIEHGYDSKNAAHLIRLLRMCKEFLQTGEMTVYRAADRDELLDIKRGKWPLEDVKSLANQLFSECKYARDFSDLPEGPDRKCAEQLLIDIIRRQI